MCGAISPAVTTDIDQLAEKETKSYERGQT